MNKQHWELAVIGAGPAGLTAAREAAEQGAEVVLFDEQPAPGGQIYRGIESTTPEQDAVLGKSYRHGAHLARALRASAADYRPGATVWQLSGEREIGVSRNGVAEVVTADHVIVATGAMERPFPVPGWTLPGVATAGAAQILLKSSGLVAENAVFVGSGPLLTLVVAQYLRAGAAPLALIDTTSPGNRRRALPELTGALRRWDLLRDGLSWMREIRRAGIRIERAAGDLAIEGKEAVEALRFRDREGTSQTIACERVFLHQGVVPNVNLTMAAGCRHHWDTRQLCWRPETDDWYESSIAGISIVGDGAGIAGALAAEQAGRIAADGALERLGRLERAAAQQRSAEARRALKREELIRPFLDLWFRPCQEHRIPADDATVVCRCEEVTAGELRAGIALGAPGPNQLKAFCRAGMGPCQGRFCGLTVTEMMASETGRSPEEIGYYRLRPPVKPLALGELAALASGHEERGDRRQAVGSPPPGQVSPTR